MKNRKNYLKRRKRNYEWKQVGMFAINPTRACDKCGRLDGIIQIYKYDAWACINCNEWLESVYSRPEYSYHLMVSFNDNGEKILYTEAYKGYPSSRLKSANCNVYKWKGKYIEADFDLKSTYETHQSVMIPIQKRKINSPWKVGRAKEV